MRPATSLRWGFLYSCQFLPMWTRAAENTPRPIGRRTTPKILEADWFGGPPDQAAEVWRPNLRPHLVGVFVGIPSSESAAVVLKLCVEHIDAPAEFALDRGLPRLAARDRAPVVRKRSGAAIAYEELDGDE